MKVTVCFGQTRVVVPCGNGDLLVRDVTQEAIRRYIKALNKSPDSWVKVTNLTSLSDGGILDPDDKLKDLVDDKEQILAIFDEQDAVGAGMLSQPPSGGSGGGGSSAGTSSPEWTSFRDKETSELRPPHKVSSHQRYAYSSVFPSPSPKTSVENSVEITNLDAPPTSGLLVVAKREREKERHAIETNKENNFASNQPIRLSSSGSHRSKKRAAPRPPVPSEENATLTHPENSRLMIDTTDNLNSHLDNDLNDTKLYSSRQPKLLMNGGTGLSVPSAPDTNANYRSGSLPPPGAIPGKNKFSRAGNARQSSIAGFMEQAMDLEAEKAKQPRHPSLSPSPSPSPLRTEEITILLPKSSQGKNIGIQVAPVYGDSVRGKLKGIKVTQIVKGERAFEDGRMQLNDMITEISSRPVYQMSFVRAQSYLHEASRDPKSVEFKLIREVTEENRGTGNLKPSPPISLLPSTPHGTQSALQKANTKKIGTKMIVELKKGGVGLGFTVTSRDTAMEHDRPFYIKTVLPKGAAIEDGRLQAGDRLLQVNTKEITGMSQRDVVDMLRGISEGDIAKLIISRVLPSSESNSIPTTPSPENLERRCSESDVQVTDPLATTSAATTTTTMTSSDASDSGGPTGLNRTELLKPSQITAGRVVPDAHRDGLLTLVPSPASPLPRPIAVETTESKRRQEEISKMRKHVLNIPLNSTGSAGLGVSVKGRTATSAENGSQEDCGIFIKLIMHGGAAHKDGRLRVNDQLIGVNETSLQGFTNEEALDLVRQHMRTLDPSANAISLTVLRLNEDESGRKGSSSSSGVASPPPLPSHPPPDWSQGHLLTHSPVVHLNAPEPTHVVQPLMGPPGGGRPPSGPALIPLKRYNVGESGEHYAAIMKKMPSAGGLSTVGMGREVEAVIIEEDNGDTYQPLHPNYESLYEDVERLPMEEPVALGDEVDPFSRDSHLRQSISEKRHMGAHNNPSHSQTYQRIKHARQSSDVKQRRSLSLESLNHVASPQANGHPPLQPEPSLMIHELAFQGQHRGSGRNPKEQKRHAAVKKANRQRPTNDSFRTAVDRSYQSAPGVEAGMDVADRISGKMDTSNNHYHSLPRDSKATQERRKSTHGGFFSKLRFGNHSREQSPEKRAESLEREAQERAKKAAQEEQQKIREQYEKLKRQQQQNIMRQRQQQHQQRQQNMSSPSPVPHHQHHSQRSQHSQQQHQQQQWSGHPSTSSLPPSIPPPYYRPPPPHHAPPPPDYNLPPNGHIPYPGSNPYYAHHRRDDSPYRDYEEQQWFAIAAEHDRFYRSLERQQQQFGTEGRTERTVPRREHTPPRFWPNGDMKRTEEPLSSTSGSTGLRPPRPPHHSRSTAEQPHNHHPLTEDLPSGIHGPAQISNTKPPLPMPPPHRAHNVPPTPPPDYVQHLRKTRQQPFLEYAAARNRVGGNIDRFENLKIENGYISGLSATSEQPDHHKHRNVYGNETLGPGGSVSGTHMTRSISDGLKQRPIRPISNYYDYRTTTSSAAGVDRSAVDNSRVSSPGGAKSSNFGTGDYRRIGPGSRERALRETYFINEGEDGSRMLVTSRTYPEGFLHTPSDSGDMQILTRGDTPRENTGKQNSNLEHDQFVMRM